MNSGIVTNMPNVTERTVIRNDAECIRILTDENLLDRAVCQPPYNTTNLVFQHDGYYCLCLYREGFSHPEDNGYEIFAIPRSNCSPLEASAFFAEILLADSVTGSISRDFQIFAYGPVESN